jgi:hypothetical protein
MFILPVLLKIKLFRNKYVSRLLSIGYEEGLIYLDKKISGVIPFVGVPLLLVLACNIFKVSIKIGKKK